MNKKTAHNKRKLYTWIFVISLIGLLIGSYIFYQHILSSVLAFQQNVIGVLSQNDEQDVEKYIHAMFEPVSQENIQSGNAVLEKYGYTDAGIQYIGRNMGLETSKTLGICLLFLCVGIVLWMFYQLRKQHKLEIEILQQEIVILQQKQMKDEYVVSQNQRIQNFIENIAHQMKTPLSRVYSSLDIVEASFTDNAAKHHIEECYSHLDSINVLMKRLMDIGRLEAGKVIFQKEKLSLKGLLTDVVESCTEAISRVKVSCENDLEYYGDTKWLKEAFSNILCNALEADKKGHPVEIMCTQSADFVKISIRDYGPGICEKDIPNIFDRFYLPENAKENHTGIGLNLAKLIIEGHMGSIYVYNHLEGGAVFQVILPLYDSLKVRG